METVAADVARDFYIQFGAVALLAAAGWGVAWLLYRNNIRLQQRYDELLIQVLQQNSELNGTLERLTTGLKLDDLLEKHSIRGRE